MLKHCTDFVLSDQFSYKVVWKIKEMIRFTVKVTVL